jgi:hypothetical protein
VARFYEHLPETSAIVALSICTAKTTHCPALPVHLSTLTKAGPKRHPASPILDHSVVAAGRQAARTVRRSEELVRRLGGAGEASAPLAPRSIAARDLPQASNTTFGAARCDGGTKSCAGGVIGTIGGGAVTSLAAGNGGGGAPTTGSVTIGVNFPVQAVKTAAYTVAGPDAWTRIPVACTSYCTVSLPQSTAKGIPAGQSGSHREHRKRQQKCRHRARRQGDIDDRSRALPEGKASMPAGPATAPRPARLPYEHRRCYTGAATMPIPIGGGRRA